MRSFTPTKKHRPLGSHSPHNQACPDPSSTTHACIVRIRTHIPCIPNPPKDPPAPISPRKGKRGLFYPPSRRIITSVAPEGREKGEKGGDLVPDWAFQRRERLSRKKKYFSTYCMGRKPPSPPPKKKKRKETLCADGSIFFSSFLSLLPPSLLFSVQTSEAWEKREENSEHNSFILENVSFPQKGARKAFFLSRGLLLSTPPAFILPPLLLQETQYFASFPSLPFLLLLLLLLKMS